MKEYITLGVGMVLAFASIIMLETIEKRRCTKWEKKDF